jgi:hypothetical protein
MKNKKWNEPELMADDHHGQYMMQLLVKDGLKPFILNQIKKQVTPETWESLQDVNNEWHFDACDTVTGLTLKTETGQKFSLQYAEGGLWAIPACFMRTKKANDFFGC